MAAAALRAPADQGGILAVPPLADLGPTVAENRRRLAAWQARRTPAVAEALAAARAYHQERGLPGADAFGPGLLVTGHQPELFHPGVWAKNFALHALAARHRLTPLNLIIDNDQAHSPGIHVPAGHRRLTVPFDQGPAGLPYEEWAVRDPATFAAFPAAVRRVLGPVPWAPLLPQFWCEVEKAAARTTLIGERFAWARRAVEESWGCRNLELPLSRLCQTTAFATFVADLVAEPRRLWEVYNAELTAFRTAHGIRSPSHPAPALAREDGWYEAPLWAWKAGDRQRGRVFARRERGEVALRRGAEVFARLPLGRAGGALAAVRDLPRQGVKLRSRALTTTLFARLYLADLFIHGLGGGIYDGLTDQLIRALFGLEPPTFLVLTATLRLPQPDLPTGPTSADLRRQLRRLRFNPDAFLSDGADPCVRQLCQRKADLLAVAPTTPAQRRERWRALRAVRDELEPHVATEEAELRQRIAAAERRERTAAVWRNREYAFVLFPAEELRGLMGRVATML